MRLTMNDDGIEHEAGERAPVSEPPRLSFSMAARNGFFQRVIAGARRSLPPELAQFQSKPGFDLVKLWFENERIHYEAAIDLHREHIEIALHFEDGPISTALYLRAFDAEIVEIKHELGSAVELERWTQSWGRVFELTPLTALDGPVGDAAGKRMAAFITELQPIVSRVNAPPERSAQPKTHEPYRWGGKGRRPRV